MQEVAFDEWIAARYPVLWPELFRPEAITPVVDFLAGFGGPALEFGVGTGRIATPLHDRGIEVHGIDVSPAMIARTPPGVTTTNGNFAYAKAGRNFSLVYVVRNTITNLTTQDEQVAAFHNAAAHLAPGGRFVMENYVPALRRLPPGETRTIFTADPDHTAYEEYEAATQTAVSHHTWTLDGAVHRFDSRHRYVWPSELDLMAGLAGLTLQERWSDWHRSSFTAESPAHISVWSKP